MGVAISAECYRYPFISPSLLRSSSPRLCLETIYPVKAQQEIGACFRRKPRGVNTCMTCPCVHSYPHPVSHRKLMHPLLCRRSDLHTAGLGTGAWTAVGTLDPCLQPGISYQHFHPKLLEQLSNNCQCLSNTWPLQCLWLRSTNAAWDSYKGRGGLLAVTCICVQCLFHHLLESCLPSIGS